MAVYAAVRLQTTRNGHCLRLHLKGIAANDKVQADLTALLGLGLIARTRQGKTYRYTAEGVEMDKILTLHQPATGAPDTAGLALKMIDRWNEMFPLTTRRLHSALNDQNALMTLIEEEGKDLAWWERVLAHLQATGSAGYYYRPYRLCKCVDQGQGPPAWVLVEMQMADRDQRAREARVRGAATEEPQVYRRGGTA